MVKFGEVGAATSKKGFAIVEDRIDLGIAGDRPDIVALEPHGRTSLAQFLVDRKRIFEKLAAKRIDTRNRCLL